jgi:hypothetical protein
MDPWGQRLCLWHVHFHGFAEPSRFPYSCFLA